MKEYTKKQKYFETIQPKDFKREFAILNSDLIYLDNAATTQKPNAVIERVKKFYENENSNAHSGIYKLSEKTAEEIEIARKTFAGFINAEKDEIIFTRNATDSFNMLAEMLNVGINKGDNIIVTELEHHSNFIPWQQLAKKEKCEFRIAKYDVEKEEIHPENLVDAKTRIVSFTLMSNVTGILPDAERIISAIKRKNNHAIIILDATQAAAHIKIDVKRLDVDFLCFSAHKMYGPAGVGILYGRKNALEGLEPKRYGGSMIKEVTPEKSTWADIPSRFEPGTMNAEGIIGAAEAVKYMQKNNSQKLFKKEEEIKIYAVKKLKSIQGIEIVGHKKGKYSSIIAFTMKDVHPHDVAEICSRKNICIRAGHHCAQPFHAALRLSATNRISISFYNDKKDIDKLVDALREADRIFR